MNSDKNKAEESNRASVKTGGSRTVISAGSCIGIGMTFGAALGLLTKNLALGVAVGVALGAGVGAALEGAEKRRSQSL